MTSFQSKMYRDIKFKKRVLKCCNASAELPEILNCCFSDCTDAKMQGEVSDEWS